MTGKAKWVRVAIVCGVVVLAGAVLAGCGYSAVRLAWVETQMEGYWSATYDTFDGVDATMCLVREGQVIHLSYDLNVDEGKLTVAVIEPDGSRLWTRTFEEPVAGSATVVTKMAGRHAVRVEGEATSGGFDLTWNLDEGQE